VIWDDLVFYLYLIVLLLDVGNIKIRIYCLGVGHLVPVKRLHGRGGSEEMHATC
jgi:hypothetical protein